MKEETLARQGIRLPVVVLIAMLGLVVVTGLWGFSLYNRLVGLDEGIKAAWAQVDNQLQRRSDLIPNLVETVRGFAAQERGVFQDIANARAKLAGAQTPADRIGASNDLSSALSRLLVVVENYPQLKSDTTFNRLMDELAGTENRIAVERKRYNDHVNEYNAIIRRFPGNIVASMTGFIRAPYFEPPEAAREAPKVKF
ncbi:MAG TPA: LemA family protein [Methylomirabilota bacterium]|nr:LemA family protein [Methylomirabilota bacterium]